MTPTIQQTAQSILDEVHAIEHSSKLSILQKQLTRDVTDSCAVIRERLDDLKSTHPQITHEICEQVFAMEVTAKAAVSLKPLATECDESCVEIRLQLSILNRQLAASEAANV